MKVVLVPSLLALTVACCGLAFRSVLVRDTIKNVVDAIRAGRSDFSTLYLIYGVVAISCLAILTPPYQVPDENAHFLRADNVELGSPIGDRLDGKSGGVVDSGVPASASVLFDVPFHPETKVTAAMLARAALSRWNESEVFSEFPNTAIYPPYFYTVSALAIAIGKTANLSVTGTLILARLMNGLVGIGLGAVAIGLAGGTGPWFFAVLTLPMTLAQTASVSQDALLLPMAALAGALYIRLSEAECTDIAALALFSVLLALTATGRFPYGTLALLPLVLFRFAWWMRMAAAAAVASATVAWMWVASTFTLVPFGPPGADALQQIRHVLEQPTAFVSVFANTWIDEGGLYLESFVGRLGWMDLQLPLWYRDLAGIALAVAAVSSIRIGMPTLGAMRVGCVAFLAILLSVGALFAAFYLTWTAVGAPTVAGVQGRYFIPLAFFVPAVIAIGSRPLPSSGLGIGRAVVGCLPLITIPVVVLGLVTRYS